MDSYSCTSSDVVKFSHTWEIESFDFLKSCNALKGLKSTDFAASEDSNDKFSMELETAGNEPNEFLRVYLKKSSTNNCSKYKHDMSISLEKNGCCKPLSIKWSSYYQTFEILLSQMYNEPNKISPDATLRIRCEMTILLTDPVCLIQNKFALPKCRILDDLFALLSSEEFADVTIVTGDGKNIPAHKNILSARSKVFAAMFKHPLEESQQNCVKISDFKYKVVLEMLRFIYTGCAPNLEDMAEELLSAADKYDLELLKAMCFKYLNDNLSVESAAMTLKLADLYQEKELKSNTIKYIKDHSKSVLETPYWKGLVKTDQILILGSFCALKLDDEKYNQTNCQQENIRINLS